MRTCPGRASTMIFASERRFTCECGSSSGIITIATRPAGSSQTFGDRPASIARSTRSSVKSRTTDRIAGTPISLMISSPPSCATTAASDGVPCSNRRASSCQEMLRGSKSNWRSCANQPVVVGCRSFARSSRTYRKTIPGPPSSHFRPPAQKKSTPVSCTSMGNCPTLW